MPATTILHAFEIGDRIFTITSRHDAVRKLCDACRGTKILRIRQPGETRVRCRKCAYCGGSGTMPNGQQQSWNVRGPATITEVDTRREVSVDKDGKHQTETRVRYSARTSKGDTWPFGNMAPDDVFSTKRAATAAARKRNSERTVPPTKEAA